MKRLTRTGGANERCDAVRELVRISWNWADSFADQG
jgi:hypothetical protein